MKPVVMGLTAGLSALTLGIHLFAGGPEYHAAFRSLLTDPFHHSMASVLWHAVTVNLAILTVAALIMRRAPNGPLAYLFSAMMLGWAALFLYFGATDLGTIWVMPQWVIFFVMPGLLIWGHRGA